MEQLPDMIYRLAFATFRNMNVGLARKFADHGISPKEFFTLSVGELHRLSGLNTSVFREDLRSRALVDAGREARFMEQHNVTPRFWDSEDYPVRLSQCDDAPAVLFTMGAINPSVSHAIAIVGTRHSTAYGADMCRQLVHDLHTALDDLVIISGLAYGIDVAAHRAALEEGVPTGAILAHGFSTLYPAEHRVEARRMISEGGFLASEYTSGSPIHRGQFLARNRIVAGMADVVIVVESDLKGGAMATARIANAYNREVMAVPGRTTDRYSRGTNQLIAQNAASMVRDASDVIALCGWSAKTVPGDQQVIDFKLSDDQRKIIDFLRAEPDSTVNEVCLHLGIPFSELSAILFGLEMDGIVASVPGGRYCIINSEI